MWREGRGVNLVLRKEIRGDEARAESIHSRFAAAVAHFGDASAEAQDGIWSESSS